MGDGFRIDPGHVRGLAPRFGQASDDLDQARWELSSALAGLGEAWGGDEVGQAFAAEYLPLADKVLRSLETLSRGMGGIEEALRAVAANVERTDHAAGARFGGLRP